MKTKTRFNYRKINSLVLSELKRIWTSLPTLILIILTMSISFNVIKTIDEGRGLSFNKTVAIVDDDRSLEVKLFLKNITSNKLSNILQFKNTDITEAKKMLARDDVSAIIHIEKDTFKQLNYGENARINVYYNNKNDIVVNFMVNYMENLISVLNHGQNGAMIYYKALRGSGYTRGQAIDQFNNIYIDYVKEFITRDRVFDKEDFNNFVDTSFIEFYFIGILLTISIIFTYAFHWSLERDMKEDLLMRQILCGYSIGDIAISRIIVGTTYITALISIILIFYYRFSSLGSFGLGLLLIIVGYSFIINCLCVGLYLRIHNNIQRGGLLSLIIVVLLYLGGLIIPIRALPGPLYSIRGLNIIYVMQSMLTTNGVKLTTIIVTLAYVIISILAITRIDEERALRW